MFTLVCEQCGETFDRKTGEYNRAIREGYRTYCSRKCTGIARRFTKEHKKELKRLYDIEYRKKNREKIKIKRALEHKSRYTYEYGRKFREARKDYLTRYKREYYARPENKAHKAEYDRVRRAKIYFGEWWEAALHLQDLEKEVFNIMPGRQDRAIARGYYNKRQMRARHARIERQES